MCDIRPITATKRQRQKKEFSSTKKLYDDFIHNFSVFCCLLVRCSRLPPPDLCFNKICPSFLTNKIKYKNIIIYFCGRNKCRRIFIRILIYIDLNKFFPLSRAFSCFKFELKRNWWDILDLMALMMSRMDMRFYVVCRNWCLVTFCSYFLAARSAR